MKFSMKEPLKLLTANIPIIDSHTHVWEAAAFPKFWKWASTYNIDKVMAIAAPDVREELVGNGYEDKIVFAYYLSSGSFARYETKIIIEEIEAASSLGYNIVKMWFGPRFLDFTGVTTPFHLNSIELEPVFSLIEDLGMIIDIHVADPDFWYEHRYTDTKRYGTKKERIDEFIDLLRTYKRLIVKSVHFGSLPEDLSKLQDILDEFPKLVIDTASTKWIIRELGRNPEESKEWIKKYSDRVLFATDLSAGWTERDDFYYATRYWSQRIFWETDKILPLPFKDEDNLDPRGTVIHGLSLDNDTLKKIYYLNSKKFFKL